MQINLDWLTKNSYSCIIHGCSLAISSYYLNIIGKFLIEAWLDEKVANNLEQLYQNTLSWNDEVIKKIQLIVAAAGKMKIIISRNKQRAAKMSKIFKKDFHPIGEIIKFLWYFNDSCGFSVLG